MTGAGTKGPCREDLDGKHPERWVPETQTRLARAGAGCLPLGVGCGSHVLAGAVLTAAQS